VHLGSLSPTASHFQAISLALPYVCMPSAAYAGSIPKIEEKHKINKGAQ